MAHWIIEDYGFGGQNYRCSNCRESWNDIYFDVSTEDCCPNCHKPINEDETEYIDTPNKHIADNAIIFPQTIGDITFYSKGELFEWIEKQQKINGINDWKKLGYTDEESQELFEASKIPVTISSDINIEELERIADEFSRIGCTSFRLIPEEIERILNNESN